MTDNPAQVQALRDECFRQVENCQYTTASFIEWLRFLRWLRLFSVVSAAIFGTLATWSVVQNESPLLSACFTLLATVIPLIHRAANLDARIAECSRLAGEFTNLRDRFRQMAEVAVYYPFSEFDKATSAYLERLEKARGEMMTPPEFFFRRGQKKVQSGDYQHDYDQKKAQ